MVEPVIPAEKPEKRPPTQEPIEKTPQFLLNLEDRTERIRSMVDSFVRQFEDLDGHEKTAFISRIQVTMNQLITSVIGLARTRGEDEELRAELALHLKPKTWKNAAGKFDYGKYVASVNNALASLQVFLERNQMLLTFQPVPADFSEQLIEGILDDIKSIAEDEARKALDKRHQEQAAKFRELEAAGKLTPERLALLSEEERRMLDSLAVERFDEGLDELDEEDAGEGGVEMDDSGEPEMDESGQPETDDSVPEIDDEEVD